MTAKIEPIVGRYVHVEIEGERNRIYFEENGAGIPLVCLHTAGSDGRQWRHFLADEEFAKDFRIISFDMPRHGRVLHLKSLGFWSKSPREVLKRRREDPKIRSKNRHTAQTNANQRSATL